jgi:hypothetical protein
MTARGDRIQAERLVKQSLQEGWRAFARAPLWFVGFGLLVLALLRLTLRVVPWHPLAAHLAALLLALWGSTSLLRAAAVAVDGGRPGPGLLLRFDAAACRQLFLAAVLVAALLLLALLPVYALIALSGRFAPATDPFTALLVTLLPLVPALVLLALLPLAAVLAREPESLLQAVLRCLRLGTGQCGAALVLAAVQLGLLLLGAAHPVLLAGLALPLAICLGIASERQFSRVRQRPLNRAGGS